MLTPVGKLEFSPGGFAPHPSPLGPAASWLWLLEGYSPEMSPLNMVGDRHSWETEEGEEPQGLPGALGLGESLRSPHSEQGTGWVRWG